MKPEEVISIAYNRGLRPIVARDLTGERVEWVGGKLSPALSRVVESRVHAEAILELVKSGFTPPLSSAVPTVGSVPSTTDILREYFPDGTEYHPPRPASPGTPEFDEMAENAVSALYSAGVGLFPSVTICVKTGEPVISWQCLVSPEYSRRAAEAQIAAIAPLRERIKRHLSPRPGGEYLPPDYKRFDSFGGNFALEFRVRSYPDGHGNRVWKKLVPARDVRHPFCMEPGTRYDAWRWWGEDHWRVIWGRYESADDGRKLIFRPWGL